MMSGVSAFLWQAALMLLAAYFLGAFIGCWLRRRFGNPPKVAMEALTDTTGEDVGTSVVASTSAVAATTAAAAAAASETPTKTTAPQAAEIAGAMGDAAARTASAEPSTAAPASKPAEPVTPEAPVVPEETREAPVADPEPKQFTPPMSAAAAAAAALAARQAAKAAEHSNETSEPTPASQSPGLTAAKMETMNPPAPVSMSDLPTASGSSGQAVVAAQVAQPDTARMAASDDLTLIEGVSADDAKTLDEAGFSTFAAIAALSAADVGRLNGLLGGRRVSRENWIEQAQLLQSGAGTAFSKRAHPDLAPRPPALSSAPSVAPSATASAPAAEAVSAATAAGAAAVATTAASATTQPTQAATVPTPEVSTRAAFSRERRHYADDLQQIDGINAEVEKLLNEQGVTHISQIASWRLDEQKRIDRLLGSMGRVKRERWVEQARRISGVAEPEPKASSATASAASVANTDAPEPVSSATAAEPALSPPHNNEPSSGSISPIGASAASGSSVRGLRSVRSEALVGPNSVNNDGVNDDLKYIRGIGVLIEKRLRAMGYTSYAQIASWTQSDVDRVNQQLDFRGRIERENWIEQARILAAGGQTDFSRRQDRDDN